MRYRMRYNVGPLFGGPPSIGAGLLASILTALWYVVAFIAQLVVWVVLFAVGIVYTIVWLVLLPFSALL